MRLADSAGSFHIFIDRLPITDMLILDDDFASRNHDSAHNTLYKVTAVAWIWTTPRHG